MKADLRTVLVAVVALGLGGCNWYYNTLPSPDDAMKLVPWFDHMVKSPAFHPYQRSDIPRNTVAGSVPVDAVEMDWSVEWLAAGTATADRLINPTDPAATAAVGDTLYGVFCSHCHGVAGDGRGPVAPKIGAPSLLTEKAMGLSDGNIYSIIRYGRGVMPRQGDRLVAPEGRWAVVNHVRALQAAGGIQ